jgi:PAS domain S-box-containing protein
MLKNLAPTWISYLVAVVAVTVMLSLRALLPLLGEAMALMPLVVAVFIAAWYGGLRPGIMATILCALAALFFFTSPARVFWMIDVVDQIQVLTFILVGVLISYLCETLHQAQRAASIGQRRLQQEIEERQKFETDALQSLTLLQAITENASTAIFVKDLEGRYLLGNRNMCELFNVSKEQLTGLTDYDILPPDIAEKLRANDREVAEKNRTIHHEEFVIVHGEPQSYVSVKFPLHDASGKVYASGGIATNITDLKKTQQALQESEIRLKEADRRKDEFLATLAHELRNPLAPIRNALSLLRQTDNRQVSGPALDIMERQLQQMVRLIDDLLDVSRITRNRLELRRQRVELGEIINNAVETVQPILAQSDHRFTLTLSAGPLWLDADPLRLAQVFSNLLNNAIKYSPAGGAINLTAGQADGEAVIRISDSGIGIPADKLTGVFDMFMQVDRSLEQSHGGLGIGLTLVQYLVTMHQGRVSAASAGAGKGSEFTVCLPLTVAVPAPTPAQDSAVHEETAKLVSRRIVVADDNEDAANSLSMILSLLGYEVRTAYDGRQAVEAAADFQPDVVFLDIGMPRLNGYDAARQIRNQPGGGDIMLIAITGWGQKEDRDQAKTAGFDHHLVKPVEVAVVKALLAQLSDRQVSEQQV